IHNVLIIGAGDVGEMAARSFLQNPQIGYQPVGFVDENESIWGKRIHGLTVYGGIEKLPELVVSQRVSEVLVATPKPSLRFLNRIVEICEKAHVGFKIAPSVGDVMAERVSITQIRPVDIEDLLGREPVEMNLSEDMNYLRDEVVLVTGAGGSIGSELCRQIMRGEPGQLLLLGRGENSIYEIATELGLRYRNGNIALIIADIQDVERMEAIFSRYRPTVVFHAAAHKHVPLMEMHPSEAVKNNVFGTFNIAFFSKRYEVKRFILISTDKAVRPSSVMGASKRVAEMIVSSLSHGSTTSFVAVRFGNVLGSRGSVVPLFRRQIAAGGPVTVTHPEVERFFMTIPEAVNLVLQAGFLGDNGQLFLLDMGEPVRIAELARRMITLSGYEPDVDIDIQFTGLRPGEKLIEELLTHGEDLCPTSHHKIFATRVEIPDVDTVKKWLQRLDSLILDQDSEGIVRELRRIVPEFKTPEFPPTPEQSRIAEA
ncbi:polysaccharide biosynthesis protein, partial [bacterium]|nr:polysaccharide biosynthesis protein [bacterium]